MEGLSPSVFIEAGAKIIVFVYLNIGCVTILAAKPNYIIVLQRNVHEYYMKSKTVN